MKIIKYFKDNCPGCEQLSVLSKAEGYVFDKEVHAMQDLNPQSRRELRLMAVPTVILFDDNEKEIDRFTGVNPMKLAFFFSKRDC